MKKKKVFTPQSLRKIHECLNDKAIKYKEKETETGEFRNPHMKNIR